MCVCVLGVGGGAYVFMCCLRVHAFVHAYMCVCVCNVGFQCLAFDNLNCLQVIIVVSSSSLEQSSQC